MTVIQYGRHEILDEDIEAVVNVLRGDFLTTGPFVKEFEKNLAEVVHARHAIAVTNGTAALHIICLALELGTRDAVVVPAITFAATSNAALYTGAKVFFADIEPETLGMCPASAKRAIEEARRQGFNPKAIFAVHFAGRPFNLAAISKLAKENNMYLVEDACHALGATYRKSTNDDFKPVGFYADFAAWSFHPVKHVATGEGGAVTCNDSRLAEKASLLRTHGISRDASQFKHKQLAFDPVTGAANPWYHEMQMLGYNYRMPDINAVLGNSQLKRIKSNIENRRRIAKIYHDTLSQLDFVKLPPNSDAFGEHAYHLFCISVNFKGIKKTRAQVMNQLLERQVGVQVHYIPVFWHPFYQEHKNLWWADSVPNATSHYEQVLSIPMFHALDETRQKLVIHALTEVLKP